MKVLLDVEIDLDVANLAALIPIYDSNGANVSQLYLRDGRILTVDMRLKSFLNKLKSRSIYNVDFLSESQAIYLGQKQLLPVPLAPSTILWVVKVRRPIGGADGAYGYLAIGAIKALTAEGVYIQGQEKAIKIMGSKDRLQRELTLIRALEPRIFQPTEKILTLT